jgi:hypothetical protein
MSCNSRLHTDVTAQVSASWIGRLGHCPAVNRTVHVLTNLLAIDCAVYENFDRYEPIGRQHRFLGFDICVVVLFNPVNQVLL